MKPHILNCNKPIIFVAFFVILNTPFFSQTKNANIWYFGNKAGLDFNSGNPVALTNSAMNTTEGCASVADAAGQLLFYTDGQNIWDKNHQMMPLANGTTNADWNRMLSGTWSSTQAAIIAPVLNSANRYYVFSTDGASLPAANSLGPQQQWDGLYYTVVNMQLNGGLGDIDTSYLKQFCNYLPGANKIQLTDSVSEKVTIAMNANGLDYWVITTKQDTRDVYAFSVNCTGVNCSPVISTLTSGTTFGGYGMLSASRDGKSLAMAWGGTPFLGATLVDFNNTTGVASNRQLLFQGEICYGACFSPDDNLIYITTHISAGTPGAGAIRNFQRFSPTPAATMLTFNTPTVNHMNIQQGPNGKLYSASWSTSSITEISNPNNQVNPGVSVGAVSLAGKISLYGLPNLFVGWTTPPPSKFVSAADTAICNGGSTQLAVSLIDPTFTYKWTPAAGLSNATSVNPIASPTVTTTYTVAVMALCDTLYDSLTVLVRPNPFLSLGPDVSVCPGNATTLSAQHSGVSILWSTGVTSTSISASVGAYSAVVTDSFSCVAYDTVAVLAHLLPVIQISSPAVCLGSPATLQATGASNYLWSNAMTGSSIVIPALSNQTITAIGTDNNGCIDSAKFVVQPNPKPTADFDLFVLDSLCSYRVATHFIGGGVGNDVFTWNLNKKFYSNAVDFNDLSLPSTGLYELQLILTSPFNCADTAIKQISVKDEFISTLYIPNTFTPNGDDLNDTWGVKSICMEDMKIAIYNRWGVLIKELESLSEVWDGTFNGNLVESEVFVYKVIATDAINKNKIMRVGTVLVLR
ncbi:MAG: T9SS type B sorting domain-containing protein [Bacteroidetes bacterium]|nr:T9SS type B sorting domain-containing protein [Bacteroidota bacterium]